MSRLKGFFPTIATGLALGGIYGGLVTGEVGTSLVQKCSALESANVTALPGVNHLANISPHAPAISGAVFFALALGLGGSMLCYVWIRLGATLNPRTKRVWLVAGGIVCLWPFLLGDFRLAGVVFGVYIISYFTLSKAGEDTSSWGRIIGALIIMAGGMPWLLAPEGAFSNFRDRALMSTETGRNVTEAYYRWTLFPAEAIKPLAAKTQPTATAAAELGRIEFADFCRRAVDFGIICLPEGHIGGDLIIGPGPDGYTLESMGKTVAAPNDFDFSHIEELSSKADLFKPARRMTLYSLLLGGPAALAFMISSSLAWGLARVAPPKKREKATITASIFASALLAYCAVAPTVADEEYTGPTVKAAEELLSREDPRMRIRGVELAGELDGSAQLKLLEGALKDGYLPVRYRAAREIGRSNAPGVSRTLRRILASGDDWYVREQAYRALRVRGWRPQ